MVQSEYDVHALVDAYSDSLDILNEILAIFLEETPQRIESLKSAVEAKDYPSVRRIAHGLANTTGTLKADQALKAAREIERLAREDQDVGMKSLVETLESQVGEVIDRIEGYRAKA